MTTTKNQFNLNKSVRVLRSISEESVLMKKSLSPALFPSFVYQTIPTYLAEVFEKSKEVGLTRATFLKQLHLRRQF